MTDMATTPDDRTEITVQFDDNGLLQVLFGPANANLDRIEERLGVSLSAVGNTVVIHGEVDDVVPLASVLDWARPQGLPVTVVPGVGHFFHGQLPLLKSLVVRAFDPTKI